MERTKWQTAEREPPSINAFEGIKVSGVLEMIPPEYWRRLRRVSHRGRYKFIIRKEKRRQKQRKAANFGLRRQPRTFGTKQK